VRGRRGQSLLNDYCLQLGTLLERRHTERTLIEARQQAENAASLAEEAMRQAQEADRAKTKFLANMTHELRTPLNAIIGFSELIRNAPPQGSDNPTYAKYIFDSGTQLLGILNGVLDLARIEAGRLDLEEQIVSLEEVMRVATLAIEPAATKKSVAVACQMPTDRAVSLDPSKMKQVFVNLLSNAIKFTPPGGWVEIDSEIAPTGELVVAVRDNGCGIPAQHLEKVLEPFGQVEDHLTREAEGAGLGLPIARALVVLHGGLIAITSEVGVGTTVEVRLPAHRVRALDMAMH